MAPKLDPQVKQTTAKPQANIIFLSSQSNTYANPTKLPPFEFPRKPLIGKIRTYRLLLATAHKINQAKNMANPVAGNSYYPTKTYFLCLPKAKVTHP